MIRAAADLSRPRLPPPLASATIVAMSYSLGQATTTSAVLVPTPDASENAFMRFATVGRRLWGEPAPTVEYGPSTATLRYGSGQPPLNQNALLDYAKVTAVGTFVGVPIAFLLGRWLKR